MKREMIACQTRKCPNFTFYILHFTFFEAPPITGTNLVAEVYARIAGGNSNAYYCADVVVEKGPAKIRVEPLGVETNQGLLGAYEIVAMPGETNRLPLLIGPKYTVSAEVAFGSFELVPPPFVPLADDTGTVERLEFGEAFSATNVTDRLVEVQWPVEFALEEIDATPETTTYALRITPDWLDGVVTWYGIVDTNAPPMRGAPTMRSGGDSCSCGCLVRDGLDIIHSQICSCEHCSAEGECLYEGHSERIGLDMKDPSSGGGGNSPDGGSGNQPDPDLPSVSVSFDKDVVIFEAPYETSPGVIIQPRPSTRIKLTLTASGGEHGGTLSLNVAGGLAECADNDPRPNYVGAHESVQWEGYYEATNASPCQGGAVASPVFVEYQTGTRVHAKAARATAVKITIWPVTKAPGNQAEGRHTLGVCEKVNCRQTPNAPQVTWTALGGYFDDDIIRGESDKVYNCPLYADSDMLEASVGDVSYTPLLTVIQPQGVTTGAVQRLSFEPHPNQAGFVGMQIELYVLPLTVSFAYTKIEEVPSDQGTHSGYFGNPGLSRWWYHTTDNGAGEWNDVETNNFFMTDHAKMDEEMYQIQPEGIEPAGWTDGTIEWQVPYGWKSKSDHVLQPLGGTFATNIRQRFHITTNGTVTVEKHGNVISRGTNDVVTLNGVIQNGQ